jgi:hypothetical protein
MAVTIQTAADLTDLTTVAAVKLTMGTTDTSEYDGLIARLITAATKALMEYSGKKFALQTYVETMTGADSPILVLSNVPVVGTPIVTVDSEPVVDFVVQDAEKGILYRESGWYRVAWLGWNVERMVIPGTDKLDIQITYQAGWTMPGDNDRDLPDHYEEACIRTVVAWIRQDQRGGIDVKRRRVGELEVEYFDQGRRASAIPPDAKSLIGKSAV